MPREIRIHKPTHRFLDAAGAVLAIGQLRGDLLYLNRGDEKSWAVGSCAYALTGYGEGVGDTAAERWRRERMAGAWHFTFGADAPAPAICERVA